MNILLIDDTLVTAALKTILEADGQIRVTGSGGSGSEAVRLYEKLRPDLFLMDIRMKNMDGLEASRQILAAHPDAKILLLTTFSDDHYIIRAVADGLSNREVADALSLSEGTVRNYLSVIPDKLSLRDRTQLAIFYYQHEKPPLTGA